MPTFEWDEEKNKTNQQKHGISFNQATKVFDDQNRLEYEDKRRDYGESRWVTIGKLVNVFVVVVYTLRDTAIRIISARRASRDERTRYQQNNED